MTTPKSPYNITKINQIPELSITQDKTKISNSIIEKKRVSFKMETTLKRIQFQSTMPKTINRSLTNNTFTKSQMKTLENSDNMILIKEIRKEFQNISSHMNIVDRKVSFSILNQKPRKPCFLCNTQVFNFLCSGTCLHLFCDTCIKQLIKQNFIIKDNQFKCPIISCNSHIDQNIIREIYLSKETIIEKKSENNYLESNVSKEDNTIDKTKVMQRYSEKHIIDTNLSNRKTFLYYLRNKKRFCIKCLSDQLYFPHETNYLICLNCLQRMCNRCFLKYDDHHWDKTYSNHCPIISRNYNQHYEADSKCGTFLVSIFMLILGYMISYGGYLHYIITPIQSIVHKSKGRCWYYFIAIIFNLFIGIISIIVLCLFTLTIPYYSGLMLLMDISIRRNKIA